MDHNDDSYYSLVRERNRISSQLYSNMYPLKTLNLIKNTSEKDIHEDSNDVRFKQKQARKNLTVEKKKKLSLFAKNTLTFISGTEDSQLPFPMASKNDFDKSSHPSPLFHYEEICSTIVTITQDSQTIYLNFPNNEKLEHGAYVVKLLSFSEFESIPIESATFKNEKGIIPVYKQALLNDKLITSSPHSIASKFAGAFMVTPAYYNNSVMGSTEQCTSVVKPFVSCQLIGAMGCKVYFCLQRELTQEFETILSFSTQKLVQKIEIPIQQSGYYSIALCQQQQPQEEEEDYSDIYATIQVKRNTTNDVLFCYSTDSVQQLWKCPTFIISQRDLALAQSNYISICITMALHNTIMNNVKYHFYLFKIMNYDNELTRQQDKQLFYHLNQIIQHSRHKNEIQQLYFMIQNLSMENPLFEQLYLPCQLAKEKIEKYEQIQKQLQESHTMQSIQQLYLQIQQLQFKDLQIYCGKLLDLMEEENHLLLQSIQLFSNSFCNRESNQQMIHKIEYFIQRRESLEMIAFPILLGLKLWNDTDQFFTQLQFDDMKQRQALFGLVIQRWNDFLIEFDNNIKLKMRIANWKQWKQLSNNQLLLQFIKSGIKWYKLLKEYKECNRKSNYHNEVIQCLQIKYNQYIQWNEQVQLKQIHSMEVKRKLSELIADRQFKQLRVYLFDNEKLIDEELFNRVLMIVNDSEENKDIRDHLTEEEKQMMILRDEQKQEDAIQQRIQQEEEEKKRVQLEEEKKKIQFQEEQKRMQEEEQKRIQLEEEKRRVRLEEEERRRRIQEEADQKKAEQEKKEKEEEEEMRRIQLAEQKRVQEEEEKRTQLEKKQIEEQPSTVETVSTASTTPEELNPKDDHDILMGYDTSGDEKEVDSDEEGPDSTLLATQSSLNKNRIEVESQWKLSKEGIVCEPIAFDPSAEIMITKLKESVLNFLNYFKEKKEKANLTLDQCGDETLSAIGQYIRRQFLPTLSILFLKSLTDSTAASEEEKDVIQYQRLCDFVTDVVAVEGAEDDKADFKKDWKTVQESLSNSNSIAKWNAFWCLALNHSNLPFYLKYCFKDKQLLEKYFTHDSFLFNLKLKQRCLDFVRPLARLNMQLLWDNVQLSSYYLKIEF